MLFAVALLAAVLTVMGVATPAAAEPDDEGASASLLRQIDEASRGYVEATAALQQSQKRQRELALELTTIESELAVRVEAVGEIAATAYRTGRVGTLAALLNADSPSGLLDRALALNTVAANESTVVQRLTETRNRATQARAAIDVEVKKQQAQQAIMTQRKTQAEKALADEAARRTRAAQAAAGFPISGGVMVARSAPRNSDGSWPSQSCSLPDPTTAGCISPRTLHALNEAKRAGFTRYVSCFRSGGSGDHPRGMACDFAAQVSTFGGTATGGDRVYGNNLAAFFIHNASRLGVKYVIWYRQIWLPSSGWRSYSGCCDPSSLHTNHVHLSMI
jgi:hypothetical protein